jgi:hypothetical protein
MISGSINIVPEYGGSKTSDSLWQKRIEAIKKVGINK